MRHRRRGDLATEAINRYVEYGFRHGILTNFDPPYDEPRYPKYEDFEEVSRLWHERPDRWRQETDLSDGSGTTYRVVDGKGPWWFYQPPDWADWSPTNRGEFSPDGELSGLLDPYELRYSIRSTTERTFGCGTAVSVRGTVEVEAEAISWDYAPLKPFEDGADDYLLSVDAEVGVVLRLASRLRGEEFDVFEVLDIAFDEAFPEGTFRLELPGVEFRRRGRYTRDFGVFQSPPVRLRYWTGALLYPPGSPISLSVSSASPSGQPAVRSQPSPDVSASVRWTSCGNDPTPQPPNTLLHGRAANPRTVEPQWYLAAAQRRENRLC